MDYYQKIRQMAGSEPIILARAAGAVVNEGKILLVRRHNLSRSWGIPGGVQELGGAIDATARREILEEVGLDMIVGRLIGVYSSPRWNITLPEGGLIQQLTLFFQMEGAVNEIRIQESEVEDWGFFAPEEIPENTMPCCKQKVLDWAAQLGVVVMR